MELTHRFTVPVPVDEAWEHFNDISSVAECFPGASVTSADSDSFAGSVKVKLGPIALVYNGSGTFTEKDEAAHRMVVDAKGKDKRGNGTAAALVTLTMTESMTDAAGSTDIEVLTELAITGKPAQFGRGVMQDVSDKLLGQFVACLEQRFAAPASPTPPAAEPEPTLTDEAAPAAVEAPPPTPTAAAAPPSTSASAPPPAAPPLAPTPTGAKKDDALDLGATVLPVLFRTYWKHALAALAVIVLVIWLIAAL
jgi:carbon monoxide dehydrogenase subunit G